MLSFAEFVAEATWKDAVTQAANDPKVRYHARTAWTRGKSAVKRIGGTALAAGAAAYGAAHYAGMPDRALKSATLVGTATGILGLGGSAVSGETPAIIGHALKAGGRFAVKTLINKVRK